VLQILKVLFASDDFYRRFTQVSVSQRDGSTWATYRLATHELELGFFEHEGLVKTMRVQQDGEVLIDGLYFLNLEELRLLLGRIPAIRAAHPLYTDSNSIRAFSYASRTAR
jgi:hypothetical protein